LDYEERSGLARSGRQGGRLGLLISGPCGNCGAVVLTGNKMSNADLRAPQDATEANRPPAGLAGVAGEIKGLLSTLSGEIDASQQRHHEALSQIKARLAAIENRANHWDWEANGAPPVATGEPWDKDTAETLAQAYEAQDPAFIQKTPHYDKRSPAGGRPAPSGAPASPRARREGEEAPLAARLAEISSRIMHSLNDMRPQSTRLAIEQRLDQFQARMSSAVADVARRSDLASLRLIEDHVGALAEKLEGTQAQLARLEGIEDQLKVLMGQVFDDRIAAALYRDGRLAADLEAAARSACEAVQARYADLGAAVSQQAAKYAALETLVEKSIKDRRQDDEQAAAALTDLSGAVNAQLHRYEDLKALLESSMSERRQGEEQATAMLDTLQEALINVLDRIEAIEQSQHAVREVTAKSGEPAAAKPTAAKPTEARPVAANPEAARPEGAPPQDAAPKTPAPRASVGDDPKPDAAPVFMERPAEPASPVAVTEAKQPPPLPRARSAAAPAPHGDEAAEDEGWERWAETSQRPATLGERLTRAAGGEGPSQAASDRLRRDLVQDAQRAKLKAAARRSEEPPAEWAPRAPAPAKSPPRAAAAGVPRRRTLGLSPRLLAGALAIIIAINAALLIFSRAPFEFGAHLSAAPPPVAEPEGNPDTSARGDAPGAQERQDLGGRTPDGRFRLREGWSRRSPR
jgi:localization factor PodJL